MADVLVVESKVIRKGKVFLEIIFFLEIIQKEGPNRLEYAEGMTKVGVRLINADQ